MRNVLDCINAFIPLLSTEYELVLGRKGVSVTLRISFDKKDCFHLMGLQYLVDRPELSRDRGRVFDEIADGTITIELNRFLHKPFGLTIQMAIFLPFWGNGRRKKMRKLKIKKVDDKTMVICKFQLIGRNIHCSLRSQ